MTPFPLPTFVLNLLALTRLTPRRSSPAGRPDAGAAASNLHAWQPMALAAALGLFVLAGPALCYLWLGAPDEHAPQPTAVREAAPDARSRERPVGPIDPAGSDLSTSVDRLARRLSSHPGDAEGWQALGRAHAGLGQHAAAAAAFKAAARLRPDDATLLAEYAYSSAVLDPHGATDAPAQLVERALRLDPKNAKALALAGTLAVDRKDYQGAARHWEQLVKGEPIDSPLARQVRASIAQAHRLAGAQAGFVQVAAMAPAGAVRPPP